MKTFLWSLFFKHYPGKIFYALCMNQRDIKERVFLESDSRKTEVSERHSIVCQTPFCIAVRSETRIPDGAKSRLIVEVDDRPVASMHLKLLFRLPEANESIHVFQITDASCFQLNFFQQYLLLRHKFKNAKHPYLESKIYAALYSYPKRVIIVSFRNDDYYNIFPMDFQGFYPEENLYLLGLRTTNITLKKIIEFKRVVVSDFEIRDIKTIYDLGAHHGSQPPKIDDLPFAVYESEMLKFPVPEFATGYKELEIIGHQNLGSHTLLIGKIIHLKKIKDPLLTFYHVHYFEQSHVNYTGAS